MTLDTSTANQNRYAAFAFTPVSLKPPSPLGRVVSFAHKTLTITEWEVRKLRHDPTDLLTRAVQPALWLLIFGETFSRIKAINTGSESYLQFMAPGILAQSILFIAIFYGIAIIWERDLGVIHKFLASPTPAQRLCSARRFPLARARSRRRSSSMCWRCYWACR